jgi:hypothetical protein
MSKNQKKLFQAAVMFGVVMLTKTALAQGTNQPPEIQQLNGVTDNIIWVMWKQVLSNPSSALHCVVMCIIAWLIDETTWLDSKYIPHVTCLLGAATFWMYAGAATVAKCYPFPQVVLASNGLISGLLAYGGHRQIVARALNFFRERKTQNQTP